MAKRTLKLNKTFNFRLVKVKRPKWQEKRLPKSHSKHSYKVKAKINGKEKTYQGIYPTKKEGEKYISLRIKRMKQQFKDILKY
jgi:hypothetical protein